MGRKISSILFLSLAFYACDYLDFSGMVITYDDVDERFKQSMAWNETEGPLSQQHNSDEYTLYVISDSHLGSTKNIQMLFQSAQNENIDGVIMNGDLCSGNKEDYETLKTVIEAYPSITTYPIVGNHDLYFEGWEYFYNYLGSSSYYLEINTPEASDLIVMLDTGGGTLGTLQFDWFQDLLQSKRSNYRYCTVFTHNNILRSRYTISTLPMSEEVKALMELFLEHKVDYCISGHDHKYDNFTFGTTEYFVTDALLDNNDEASYLLIKQLNGEMNISRIPI